MKGGRKQKAITEKHAGESLEALVPNGLEKERDGKISGLFPCMPHLHDATILYDVCP